MCRGASGHRSPGGEQGFQSRAAVSRCRSSGACHARLRLAGRGRPWRSPRQSQPDRSPTPSGRLPDRSRVASIGGSAIPSGDAWSRCPRVPRAETRRPLGPPLSCRSVDLARFRTRARQGRSPSRCVPFGDRFRRRLTTSPGLSTRGAPKRSRASNQKVPPVSLATSVAHGASPSRATEAARDGGVPPPLPRTTIRTVRLPVPAGRNPRAVSPRPSASRSVDLPCRAPTFPSISRLKRNSCRQRYPWATEWILRRAARYRSTSLPCRRSPRQPFGLRGLGLAPDSGAEAPWPATSVAHGPVGAGPGSRRRQRRAEARRSADRAASAGRPEELLQAAPSRRARGKPRTRVGPT